MIGLEFNYGQKLDQFISTLEKFNFAFDGFVKFKDQKTGKITKTVSISKGLKGYYYLLPEDIMFITKLAKGMFFNLEYYARDRLHIYFVKN